jgi:CTP synthase
VEIIELTDHPFFIATQFHPEFESRPNRPHPLFNGLVKAAIDRRQNLAIEPLETPETGIYSDTATEVSYAASDV